MSTFRFKQFSVEQNSTSMKVGTDGVLLGAWIEGDIHCQNILDIGTGTGLISLMLAQKFPFAEIDAIDIEEDACKLAIKNAQNSEWSERIHITQMSAADFPGLNTKKYDLIASNPPFFMKGWKIENTQRKKARDAEYLPSEQLLTIADYNLSEKGSLQCIFPVTEGNLFLELIEKSDFFCKRKTEVITKEGQNPKRLLLEIVKFQSNCTYHSLTIEHKGVNNFTEEYKMLTRDFYLNF